MTEVPSIIAPLQSLCTTRANIGAANARARASGFCKALYSSDNTNTLAAMTAAAITAAAVAAAAAAALTPAAAAITAAALSSMNSSSSNTQQQQ